MRRIVWRAGVSVTRSIYVVSRSVHGRPQGARFANEQRLRLFSEGSLWARQHLHIRDGDIPTRFTPNCAKGVGTGWAVDDACIAVSEGLADAGLSFTGDGGSDTFVGGKDQAGVADARLAVDAEAASADK